MKITTTFNKDFMSLRDVKIMTELLEQLIDHQRSMGQDPTPEDEMNFFWRFKAQTSNIITQQDLKKEEQES